MSIGLVHTFTEIIAILKQGITFLDHSVYFKSAGVGGMWTPVTGKIPGFSISNANLKVILECIQDVVKHVMRVLLRL